MLSGQYFTQAAELFHSLPVSLLETTEAGFATFQCQDTVLEDWQILVINNASRYQWYGKSRQVGFSWVSAMQKLARSYLWPTYYGKPYLGVFLSINQEEAKEKIFYVMQAWERLPKALQDGPMRLVGDSKTALEFANGSRIRSHPAKAVRGLAGADITMDEAAHIQKAEAIYRGTTAASIRAKSGQGGITVGSTPLGEANLFFEIGHNDRSYPSFRGGRFYIYWWDSLALCRDVPAARAAAQAENWLLNRDHSSVAERVARFGSKNLQDEFGAQDLESFLQEYEVGFNAVSDALIPYMTLMDAVDAEWPQVMLDYTDARGAQVEEILTHLNKAYWLADGEPVWIGYDPAKRQDQAAILLVSPIQGNACVVGRLILRKTRYEVQEAILEGLLARSQTYKLDLDITGGYGEHLMERLQRRWGDMRVEGFTFTLMEKNLLASKTSAVYSQRRMVHTGDREILRQAGSVRKKITPNGRVQYEGGGPDNHADIFWALALALRDMPIEGIKISMDAARSAVASETEVWDDGHPLGTDAFRAEQKLWAKRERDFRQREKP